ncbi:glutaredoxin-like protein [Neisseria elongata subsp. glycolytica ATCC 29315]|uniref:Glutaredoxin-like protein n=1 Tax=Neisseria elongata subsp. glycolytica ATCC 29315 TaxID=546263 RepID=D4DMY4_NEIEG|nr:glutaredoxin-like protein [Neisseria elongata subsp. glycolytica ATCC 29315]
MKLTLMFREYCSLCHAMRDRLTALQQERPFELEVVDVDDDPLLEENITSWFPCCWTAIRKSAIGIWMRKNCAVIWTERPSEKKRRQKGFRRP